MIRLDAFDFQPKTATRAGQEITVPEMAALVQHPIDTTLAELYKIGPGPSSSHTMGPMLAGYNFYQCLTELPEELLVQADSVKAWLYGSLSATGKGHGTDCACLAGMLGRSPVSCEPAYLDELAAAKRRHNGSRSSQLAYPTYPLKVGEHSWQVGLDNIVFGPISGDFRHPNTMRLALLKGEEALFERTYYSVGGGFIEWEGAQGQVKGKVPYPYETMNQLLSYVDCGLSLVFILLRNEMALTGKNESQIWSFIDTVIEVMSKSVETGLASGGLLPGEIGLASKAATLFSRYSAANFTADKAISVVSSFAIACAEENARGHIVVTAPTAGSAGVMAGIVYTMLRREGGNRQTIREGLLVAAAIGYLCKHNATLSGAEGGCQAEIGVASAMAAAFLAHNQGKSAAVVENAAESALEHHLGLTCDPVGGYVQVPCIERCAFGAIKAITACVIASDELPNSHRVDFDTCVEAMELTARAMSSKYKETSEGGLAKALVLC